MSTSIETTARPAEVLMVEDNPGDVRLTREALKEGTGRTQLRVVRDGVELLSYLRRDDPYAEAVRPDLILLDLNMPRMDGRQVLQQIKADPALMTIPVVVFTSSRAEQDILRSYELGANCYVTKPMDLDEFIRAMRMIEIFWLSVARLPPG